MSSSSSSPQVLAPKERKLFNELLQAHEQKMYAKGKKLADQILKKHPQHGETMCMKGLNMAYLKERDAGIALIKEGMRYDLHSHICWHVWALIQKGEHNYEGALKSFMMALKYDKDNLNIIRETAMLQTHTRQYDALVESRLHLLRLRPYSRTNWIAAAFAHQLAGNLAEARRFLDHIDGFLRDIPTRDSEYSELVMFHVHVLEELGELQAALALLDRKVKDRMLIDRPSIAECRARLCAKLKSIPDIDATQKDEWTEAAERCWREMIEQNPHNQDYYKSFITNTGIDLASLTDESRTKALGFLEEFASKHPETSTHQRLALFIANGEKFKELVKPYIERALHKGIPSLFSDVKNLYRDPFKRQSIQEIVEDIRANASPNDEAPPPTSVDPTYYLWTLYFLAQHYSSLGQYEKALEILDTATKHTPTMPELYMTKARVLKHVGDPYGAVLAMEEARKLDGQDRYVNSKAGKYYLRAGMVAEADKVLEFFTKRGLTPEVDLTELQALHYLWELGDAHRRLKRYNLALKKYYGVQRLFRDFREQQYDFHPYSLRRGTLVSYAAMLQWEDNLNSHPAYIHAAVWAARIWILLHDDPSIIKSLHPPAEPAGEMSKKAQNKAKKAAHKTPAETSQDHDAANSQQVARAKQAEATLEVPPPKDDDPNGVKLVEAENKLERASEFLGTLGDFGKDNIDVNVTVFDVAIRQKKYLKATRALRRAHMRDPEHPEVHWRIVQLAKTASEDDIPEAIKSVLDSSLAEMKPAEVSLNVFNSQYLQRRSSYGPARLAFAKVSHMLDPGSGEVENVLFTALTEDVQLRLKDAQEMLSYLTDIESPRADAFRIACGAKFVLSKVFQTPDEQTELRQHIAAGVKDEDEAETLF